MANTYCHEKYNEPVEASDQITLSAKALIIGGYVLFVALLGALLWYGASIGIYVDPASLT
ncbi:Hypothetical protein LUCI_0550 [Lucifera butyrica]|uniref:Uncharacterized protein n=1 Tax=Lucifera butyrica TaxID=1351585 RepID=A0A498R571_9FIRM|nr:hypothetical protein [Lucifera butyrica]VBB05343.1 Hypothetical protein LUCI_0550 [Lucifera butyrica]